MMDGDQETQKCQNIPTWPMWLMIIIVGVVFWLLTFLFEYDAWRARNQ